MNINDVIQGFKVIRKEEVAVIKATLYQLEHVKTKARVVYLDRDDENKTFSIGFKTTPIDDTGVFHILEHSVLNGSKKYPVKEPFVDLLKGSLNTFLNAMTFPDKTIYPVASRNDKDFINLMRVYLDAVFNPLVVYKSPNGFYQEGWHYEINDIKDEPIYKGVVFNEMKGAFASVDEIGDVYANRCLFPDTTYGFVSGGDPISIPKLSYEQFKNTYLKYYSPTNSYIFLDGKMDINLILGIINDEYLQNYSFNTDEITIEYQKPVINNKTVEYEIGENEDPNHKVRVNYSYVIGKYDDFEKINGLNILSNILCSSNFSIIKKAIISKGLADDVSMFVNDSILQPYLTISVINTDLDKVEEIDKVLKETFETIVSNGIDKSEIEAVLNKEEFQAKERDFDSMPKGLVFNILAYNTWLYGGDVLDGILFDRCYKSLREKINSSFYTDLIKDLILNNKHQCKVVLVPNSQLTLKNVEIEKEKCHNAKLSWSNEELEEMIAFNKDFALWQASQDTLEEKATLPKLHISDITNYPKEVVYQAKDGIITHTIDTNGINYVSLIFNANDLTKEDYSRVSLLTKLFNSIGTEKYDTLMLNKQVRSILGDFATSISNSKDAVTSKQTTYFSVKFACLHEKLSQAIDLVLEIILRSKLNDTETIKNIVKQALIASQMSFSQVGHVLALNRVNSYFTKSGVLSEYTAGYQFYQYIKDLDSTFDSQADQLTSDLSNIINKVFVKERLQISIAGEYEKDDINHIINNLPNGNIATEAIIEPLKARKEGIIIPSLVGYAATGSNVKETLNKFGSMLVLSTILSYDYLWNNVRVKGGAYGAGYRCNNSGDAGFYSYRDPNPFTSIKTFKETNKYLNELVKDNTDIENYIIGAYGSFDPLLTAKSSFEFANAMYLSNKTYQDICKTHDEILSTSLNDLKDSIKAFEKIDKDNAICIIAGKNTIEENKELLDDIWEI